MYIFLLDGQSHTELKHRLANDAAAIPNLRRLIERGAMFEVGQHHELPEHHLAEPQRHRHRLLGRPPRHRQPDVLPARARETVSPQGQQFDTARFLGDGVETLYEAFHRVFGAWDGAQGGAFMASINEPCTRGADHASLERRLIGDRGELIMLTKETEGEISPRWFTELEEQGHKLMGQIDNRGARAGTSAATRGRRIRCRSSSSTSSASRIRRRTTTARTTRAPASRSMRRTCASATSLPTWTNSGCLKARCSSSRRTTAWRQTDVSLRANPARIPERDGMAAVTCEPMIYLRDLAVEVAVAHDGRTAQITISDNDAGLDGECAAIAGAEIIVSDHRDGRVARTTTGEGGVAGIAIPADLDPADLRIAVRAEGFNPRHMLLDGSNLAMDLREALYEGREAP